MTGNRVCGAVITSVSAAAVELAGGLGFSLVVIDARHGASSPFSGETENLIRAAAAAGVPALVAVPDATPGIINRVLNDGAEGVIVPDVRNAAEAARAVSAARYPPLGRRGAAPVVRAARYGLTEWTDYYAATNRERLVLASVEHDDGRVAMSELVAVEGLNGIVVDPLTAGLSEGREGALTPDELAADRDRILAADRIAGVVASPDAALAWAEAGWTLILLHSDLVAYGAQAIALRRSLDAVPRTLSEAPR